LLTKRRQIERAIRLSVARATTQGEAVDVTALAIALSSRYPQSGITLDAICGQIEAALAGAHDEPPASIAVG